MSFPSKKSRNVQYIVPNGAVVSMSPGVQYHNNRPLTDAERAFAFDDMHRIQVIPDQQLWNTSHSDPFRYTQSSTQHPPAGLFNSTQPAGLFNSTQHPTYKINPALYQPYPQDPATAPRW
jgi:hypothetical protein